MKSKEELIRIYNETVEDIQAGDYESKSGNMVDLLGLKKLKEGTKLYYSTEQSKSGTLDKPLKVYVQNIDTFLKAREMGPKCAVLNMASSTNPGGGVRNGSRAQEEDLCRRSTLLYSLYSLTSWGKDIFGFSKKDDRYPIPSRGGIYSPNVCVFRDAVTYNKLDNPFICSVISVAGVVHPKIDHNTGMLERKYIPIVKGKIRTILRIAKENKHTKLVLGALGCGAFKNPPKHIAMLFKEVFDEQEFSNSFEEICFAILEDNNSRKEHNPDGNLKPFTEIFGEE